MPNEAAPELSSGFHNQGPPHIARQVGVALRQHTYCWLLRAARSRGLQRIPAYRPSLALSFDSRGQVLGEVSIAHLGEAEDALDDADGMLNFGPHLRLPAIRGTLTRAERLVPLSFAVDEVERMGRARLEGLTNEAAGESAQEPTEPGGGVSELLDVVGSPGWTRTSDILINSRGAAISRPSCFVAHLRVTARSASRFVR